MFKMIRNTKLDEYENIVFRTIRLTKKYYDWSTLRDILQERLNISWNEGEKALRYLLKTGQLRETILRGYRYKHYPRPGPYRWGSRVELHIPVNFETWKAWLTWMSHGGASEGRKGREYRYEREIDVYASMPSDMLPRDAEIQMRFWMQDVLKDLYYPDLEEILDSWREAYFTSGKTGEVTDMKIIPYWEYYMRDIYVAGSKRLLRRGTL